MPDVKMPIALLIVVFIALLPIIAWKRSRRMFSPLFFLYVTFIYFYQDFAFAKVTAYHDTYWSFFNLFALIRQWITDGIPLGWNPYLGGGQPLLLLSNSFLYAPFFIFSKIAFYLNVSFSNEELFSIVWTLNHLLLCTGFYLLFHLWFESLFWSVFGMATILLGGLFPAELAEPLYYTTINFLPYLLFFLTLFWKYKHWPGLYLFASFLGIAINSYILLYLLSYLGIFILLYIIFNSNECKNTVVEHLKCIKANFYKLIIVLILFLIPASPFIHLYIEQQKTNYISPTRGFVAVGDKSSNTGFQPNAAAPLEMYKTLERINDHAFYRVTHTAFYIGFLPLGTLLLTVYFFIRSSSFRTRVGIFLVALIITFLLGAGEYAPLPLWDMMKQLPFFGVMRHSMFYARIVTILLIIVAIKTLQEISLHGKVLNNIMLAILLILHIINLGIFSARSSQKLISIPSSHFESLKNPSEWKLYGAQSNLIPFDVSPMIRKESIWFHYQPAFPFMIHKDIIPLLREISRKELYELNDFLISKNENDLSYKKNILIPNSDIDGCDLDCLMSKQNLRISNTYSPLYARVEVNYPVRDSANIYKAIDGNFHSYWNVDAQVNKNNGIWLKMVLPHKITVYGVRITPHKVDELWKEDKAKIEISSNNKEWTPLITLDMTKLHGSVSTGPILFPLLRPVTAKYFRLWIDDKQFSSLAELELVDKPLDRMRQIQPLPFSEITHFHNIVVNLSNKEKRDVYTGWMDFDLAGRNQLDAVVIDAQQSQQYHTMNRADVVLQVSMDKARWRTILQKTWYSFMNNQLHVFDKPVLAKYVRLIFSNAKYYPPQLGAVSTTVPIAEIKFLRKSSLTTVNKKIVMPNERNFYGIIEPEFSKNPNSVFLKIHSPEAAKLIRFENYHPNWKVYLDNQEIALQKYGPNLQLISVPEGNHSVRMEYQSWYNTLFWLHVWFVLLSWMVFCIMLFFITLPPNEIGMDARKR